jgi:hypothetical protein
MNNWGEIQELNRQACPEKSILLLLGMEHFSDYSRIKNHVLFAQILYGVALFPRC